MLPEFEELLYSTVTGKFEAFNLFVSRGPTIDVLRWMRRRLKHGG